MIQVCVMKGAYSTRGAAKKLNVSLITLQRHVAAETFPVPKIQQVGGIRAVSYTHLSSPASHPVNSSRMTSTPAEFSAKISWSFSKVESVRTSLRCVGGLRLGSGCTGAAFPALMAFLLSSFHTVNLSSASSFLAPKSLDSCAYSCLLYTSRCV